MFGMQKIHRKTCKNSYNIPVPTTIEYGNFRNHSSLNFTFLMNVLIATFHYISNVKKMYIFAVQRAHTFSSSHSAISAYQRNKKQYKCSPINEISYSFQPPYLEFQNQARSSAVPVRFLVLPLACTYLNERIKI